MNIAEKFAELSIASSKLTKKKQQTKKKIEYVSEYVRLWALVMLERADIDTLNFIDCMCNAGVYQDGDCCTSIEVLQIFYGCKTWVSIEPYPTPNIINQSLIDILNAVSFTDRIIFGRLHYNKIVSEYKPHKEFYNQCAKQVIEFCKEHHIDYHIKTGTITE